MQSNTKRRTGVIKLSFQYRILFALFYVVLYTVVTALMNYIANPAYFEFDLSEKVVFTLMIIVIIGLINPYVSERFGYRFILLFGKGIQPKNLPEGETVQDSTMAELTFLLKPAVGGKLFCTENYMVFVPHGLYKNKEVMVVAFSTIEKVELKDETLRIFLNNSTDFDIRMKDMDAWYAKLSKLMV
ncbi:hypothetical protein SAMN05216480_103114 [Pustulibacterium marinum]|uniref:GRAM domain-containing protein n=1 Tax=Pustulibacterium marinum TaxID=1224947 RepID=A0A1I7G314_9FLAO|nr:hypothetical protein [Pustulibacterium marinum]SFU42837.1 hypothetical protein SAMN05216480_103114 [Pustulibacterium marinum]